MPPFLSSASVGQVAGAVPPVLVLDTNTVMALWMFEDPRLASLRDWLTQTMPVLASREDCLAELKVVLARPQFGLAEEARECLLAAYRARVRVVAAPEPDAPALPRCRDGDDQKFLEVARDAGARWLLTRDRELLRAGRHALLRGRFEVLTPEAWQLRLASESGR